MKSRESADEVVETSQGRGHRRRGVSGRSDQGLEVQIVDAVNGRRAIDILVNNAAADRAEAAARDGRGVLPPGDRRQPDQRVPPVPRHLAPSIVVRKSGTIINMSSLAALERRRARGRCSTAKGAVVSLTKALAKEMSPHGIRVNCVAPGLIGETAFHGRFTAPAAFENATKGVLLGRAGTPEIQAGRPSSRSWPRTTHPS